MISNADIFVFVEERDGFFSSAFLKRKKAVSLITQTKKVENVLSIKKDEKKYLVLFLEGRKKNNSIILEIKPEEDYLYLKGKEVKTHHLKDNRKTTLVGITLP